MNLNKFNKDSFDRGRPRWIETIWIIFQGLFFAAWFPGSFWRVALLRFFGAKIGHNVVIKPKVRVKFPWRLKIKDHSWVGESVWIDNLAQVTIANHVCISQGTYLCTGNHNWSKATFDLETKPITIENGAWVGARSVVCPGVKVRDHSVIAAGSVAVKDTDPYTVYQGNPAIAIKKRVIR